MIVEPSIGEAVAAIRDGRVTSEALVHQAFSAFADAPDLNAMAQVDLDMALEAARGRDRDLAAGRWSGPLHGVPVTVKDLFVVDGFETRAGTHAELPSLGGEGLAVQRLRSAGAVILGKANMHEVAMGLTGENAWTGDVKNPHDPLHQSGGSSSGSAVAVAIGGGLASLCTDTGGSIRLPAAFCGLVGFKPSHGLVPLNGALPLAPTCDHAGPLALTIDDARLLTEVLSAQNLGSDVPAPLRLGVPRAYLEGRLTSAMREPFEALLERLAGHGAILVDVGVEHLEHAVAAYTPLVRAEAAHVHRVALSRGGAGFSEGVRAALENGLHLPPSDYAEALRRRAEVAAGLQAAFVNNVVAALILPSTPGPAPLRGSDVIELESGATPARDAHLALSAPFSLVGAPALSLPFGFAGGLPLGLQVVGVAGDDDATLAVGGWIAGVIAAAHGSKPFHKSCHAPAKHRGRDDGGADRPSLASEIVNET